MNPFGRARIGKGSAPIKEAGWGVRARNQVEVLSLAEKIIRASSREHPADAVLRLELKARRALQQEERAEVSGAVFAYFRWRGWLEERQPIREQLKCAVALAQRYAREPQSFSDAELLARAVPGWLVTMMKVTAPWVRAVQREPRLWLRARPGQSRALGEKLGDCRRLREGLPADALEYRGQSDLYRTMDTVIGMAYLLTFSVILDHFPTGRPIEPGCRPPAPAQWQSSRRCPPFASAYCSAHSGFALPSYRDCPNLGHYPVSPA